MSTPTPTADFTPNFLCMVAASNQVGSEVLGLVCKPIATPPTTTTTPPVTTLPADVTTATPPTTTTYTVDANGVYRAVRSSFATTSPSDELALYKARYGSLH